MLWQTCLGTVLHCCVGTPEHCCLGTCSHLVWGDCWQTSLSTVWQDCWGTCWHWVEGTCRQTFRWEEMFQMKSKQHSDWLTDTHLDWLADFSRLWCAAGLVDFSATSGNLGSEEWGYCCYNWLARCPPHCIASLPSTKMHSHSLQSISSYGSISSG